MTSRLFCALLAAAAFSACAAGAQGPAAGPAADPGPAQTTGPSQSALDAQMFYELLVGELQLRGGDPASAGSVFLDVARRTRDEALFRRAVEVALQARSGDQALAAARAWRQTLPESLDALRFEFQILAVLNRGRELGEPLRLLLARTPDAERNAAILALPRMTQRVADKQALALQAEEALKPYVDNAAYRTAARVTSARLWNQAGDSARALALAQQAQTDDPLAPAPALLGLELMGRLPAAESLVTHHLAQPGAEGNGVRLGYVRVLSNAQRLVEAESQMRILTTRQPTQAAYWLSLGALQLELRQPADAETSIKRYLELGDAAAPSGTADSEDDDHDNALEGGRTQAWLMLAQAAEMRGDGKGAAAWLDKIDDPQRALEVQTRRATLLAKQGKVREARALVQQVPERQPEDARAKLIAESQVLRDVKRWDDAHAVLAQANERFPSDVDLLYEQAMVAEKMDRMDEMERLLRRVIELKPDHQHAYNALGYSLAERNVRVAEARDLIAKAVELAPNDPFIADSLGWVEFRLGNHAQALQHLRRAYAARPDSEIAAHLGEVLWVTGARDEARRIWREGQSRDTNNEVLRETLARLQVRL
jgi:tetratricopeptide (TPR) repeat protein